MPAVRSEGQSKRNNVTSLSKRVQTTTAQRASSGRVTHVRNSLTVANIRLAKAREAQEAAERLQNMSRDERRDYDVLRGDFPDAFEDDDGWEDDVLHGRATAQISHAGEALPEDPERADAGLSKVFAKVTDASGAAGNTPTCAGEKNRTQLQKRTGFHRHAPCQRQRGSKKDEMSWLWTCFLRPMRTSALVAGDVSVASACVRRGWMPVSPFIPTVVITIRALEVYRVARLRCPRLGIQAFVRTLCDIHGVAPRQWLAAQFSVAFDVYLAIRAENACPCCLYKLEGEPCLKIPIMGTFDGNNSLSRFWLRERVEVDEGLPGDYYLMREDVDRWGKEGVEDVMKSFASSAEDGGDNDDGCSERWQNMKEDVTSRVYESVVAR
ncbi:hypothetical protein B0H14DRAFT_3712526 [Mycena olivaceomarginata]|nr:hypothetical protein B0H14DRAFT_3712526 [Mycena olivaceomarginata]